jgi:methylated-DNA-[protein]-cysteine S-methyltransferase
MTEPGWVAFETPVGVCGLAWDAHARLAGSLLPGDGLVATMTRRHGEGPAKDVPAFAQAWISRLRAVMAGAGDDLVDIPLADEDAPDFHRRVWSLARAIAPGHTRTYGELALDLGEPGAARAVGQALGANPFAPFVPCHRILAAQGGAGGFSAPGGTRTKLQLLTLEQARLTPHPNQTPLF